MRKVEGVEAAGSEGGDGYSEPIIDKDYRYSFVVYLVCEDDIAQEF